ncbi:hypothetical protein KCP73_08480 [Salmonella enterica subsp. enterica]|nr:hypothetical protein KCP73_08480 [Salmonella enterica subsp. enterica]
MKTGTNRLQHFTPRIVQSDGDARVTSVPATVTTGRRTASADQKAETVEQRQPRKSPHGKDRLRSTPTAHQAKAVPPGRSTRILKYDKAISLFTNFADSPTFVATATSRATPQVWSCWTAVAELSMVGEDDIRS